MRLSSEIGKIFWEEDICHPEEAKPTKDPDGAGREAPQLRRGRHPLGGPARRSDDMNSLGRIRTSCPLARPAEGRGKLALAPERGIIRGKAAPLSPFGTALPNAGRAKSALNEEDALLALITAGCGSAPGNHTLRRKEILCCAKP